MTVKVTNKTERAGDIVVAGIALAPLILADTPTPLHPLFAVPLFLYLIRDFKKPSSLIDRLIVSMSLSFVMLLFFCYFTDWILDKLTMARDWEVVLAIQWFFWFPAVWAVRELFELGNSRGEA